MKLEINRILDNSNFGNVSVYHEIGYTYGIYSVNNESLIGQIYNSIGVENIAGLEEDPLFPCCFYNRNTGHSEQVV